MLGRLQDTMAFASEELEQLANGVRPGLSKAAADNIALRLRNLARNLTFRIGNDENDPVPAGLPRQDSPQYFVWISVLDLSSLCRPAGRRCS